MKKRQLQFMLQEISNNHERDYKISGLPPMSTEILDLAEYLANKRPKDRFTILAQMFWIGFSYGIRSERKKKRK